tara:strand:+ start:1454 stop:2134 length:681 start_codon:yes stop_codon:yes gene_type:complete
MPLPKINIHPSWRAILDKEFQDPQFLSLENFLEEEYNFQNVFPEKDKAFEAFRLCPLSTLKVVILGQDPYHGAGQAHGLSFSVLADQKLPPSLKNIYKELQNDLNFPSPSSGDLSLWAKNSVLLLNSVLTVREKQAASHKNKGWELFTDSVIQKISENKENIVFILWGKFAQSKKNLIDSSKHLILESSHPSPFSARKGFFGSKPFSKTNVYLKSKGIVPVNWELK